MKSQIRHLIQRVSDPAALAIFEDFGARLERVEARTPSGQLDGILFASATAETAAIDGGLSAADFVGRTHSGATGFTAADVRDLLEQKA